MRKVKAAAIAQTHDPLLIFVIWATLFTVTASASLVAAAIYIH